MLLSLHGHFCSFRWKFRRCEKQPSTCRQCDCRPAGCLLLSTLPFLLDRTSLSPASTLLSQRLLSFSMHFISCFAILLIARDREMFGQSAQTERVSKNDRCGPSLLWRGAGLATRLGDSSPEMASALFCCPSSLRYRASLALWDRRPTATGETR